MAGFLEKLKLIGKSGEQDYSEVDLGQFEEPSGSSGAASCGWRSWVESRYCRR